jgi:hypothetical protein
MPPPNKNEWDTSELPADRRKYLDSGLSFFEVADAALSEAQVLRSWPEPYRNPPKGVNGARQICFRIHVTKKTYDLLHNAPDGLRGRYWQSATAGETATRFFIELLKTKLIKSVDEKSFANEIEASLDATSAKVWIREMDDAGNTMINYDLPQLRIRRWQENETKTRSKGRLWRWTPCLEEIEIKGALIDSAGIEHIPDGKRDRSQQIHCFGFT